MAEGMFSAGGKGLVKIELCYSCSPIVPSGEHLQFLQLTLLPVPAQCTTGPQLQHLFLLTGFKSLHFPSRFLLQWGLYPTQHHFPAHLRLRQGRKRIFNVLIKMSLQQNICMESDRSPKCACARVPVRCSLPDNALLCIIYSSQHSSNFHSL